MKQIVAQIVALFAYKQMWANIAGGVALALWAMESSLVVNLSVIPPLELIAVVGTIGFLGTLLRLITSGNWHSWYQPWKTWAIGISSFTCMQLSYAMAFQFAQPAEADIIYYLWPVEIIFLSCLFFKEKFCFVHTIATFIALVGVGFLFAEASAQNSLSNDYSYLIGYFLAFVASLSWAVYTLFSRYNDHLPSSMVGGYMGGAAFITGCIHFFCEETVLPTTNEWYLLIFYGLSLIGLAYVLWDYSLKHGHYQALNVMAYLAPLLALTCLTASGLAECTIFTLIACGCIVLAASASLLYEGWSYKNDVEKNYSSVRFFTENPLLEASLIKALSPIGETVPFWEGSTNYPLGDSFKIFSSDLSSENQKAVSTHSSLLEEAPSLGEMNIEAQSA